MSERRRNLFILLLVFGLIAGSAVVIISKPTRQGLDLKGGVSLVYQAKPTGDVKVDADAIERTIAIMEQRVNQLGVAEPQLQQSGPDQIDVSLPDVQDPAQAEAQVGTTAQLYFYDWEATVVDDEGKPQPEDPAVTGNDGAGAGRPGPAAHTYFDAVKIAAGFKPRDNRDATTRGLFYGVDTKTKKVLCGPQETRADAEQICRAGGLKPNDFLQVPRGYIVVQAEDGDDTPAGRAQTKAARDAYFILLDNPSLNGAKDIKDPKQDYNSGPGASGEPIVTFSFSSDGSKKWQQVTRRIAQRGAESAPIGLNARQAEPYSHHFAIVLDNRLISVPMINFVDNADGIDGRQGSMIQGSFTIDSAQRLANLIKTGALPLRLELISNSKVSATLGQQALNQGVLAGLIGFALVALFLIGFYRVLGLVAVMALCIYGVYLLALFKLIPVVLTLPGIAGLVLTLGVAADANIVIFERVKEEVRAGRSPSSAIIAGYRKGLSAIIDANVVTLTVAFILFVLATSGVKGFALTLGLGTLTSLFTAVLATQAVLGTLRNTKTLTRPAALGVGVLDRAIRFDFTGASRWFFGMSGLILVICAAAIGQFGLKFGIDFESGTRASVAFQSQQQPTPQDVRETLTNAGFEKPQVQTVSGNRELGGTGLQISLSETGAEVSRLESTLTDKYGATRAYESSSIGPTFGRTVANSAIIAIIASLLVISVYIALRFEWKFAVPVLIAVVHDILIVGGIYALFGREVTTATVAALLTILGYSLYDTIIVFDRIRENVPRMPRAAFSQIVNRAMSEVIIRSLATSLSTALPILALLIFGGSTLQDFAFALFVGVLSGAYSSIFIATPVLVHWKERESVYRNRRRRIAASNGGLVPAYATGSAAATTETKRDEPRSKRRLTSPDDPDQGVSAQEWEEMVADIRHEVPRAGRGRRGRKKGAAAVKPEQQPQDATATDPVAQQQPKDDGAADARPEDLVLKDRSSRSGSRKPRNRRHGRPR